MTLVSRLTYGIDCVSPFDSCMCREDLTLSCQTTMANLCNITSGFAGKKCLCPVNNYWTNTACGN